MKYGTVVFCVPEAGDLHVIEIRLGFFVAVVVSCGYHGNGILFLKTVGKFSHFPRMYQLILRVLSQIPVS